MNTFYIPSGEGMAELTEKRSRFIAVIRPVSTEDEARTFLQAVRKEYHDARHHCWCYRLSSGEERFSDDGEPQGSAGAPMMEVFRRENVSDFVCVVTRYFGGVLLGTGGLSRAYSGAAKLALQDAGLTRQGLFCELRFSAPYSMLERLRNELLAAGAQLGAFQYGADVTLCASVPLAETDALCMRLREMSGGSLEVSVSEPSFGNAGEA